VSLRAEVLYVFSIPLAPSISGNNPIKWHRFHPQALQAQPDNHFGKGEGERAVRSWWEKRAERNQRQVFCCAY
jgi:hypothetical protein